MPVERAIIFSSWKAERARDVFPIPLEPCIDKRAGESQISCSGRQNPRIRVRPKLEIMFGHVDEILHQLVEIIVKHSQAQDVHPASSDKLHKQSRS